MVFFFVLCNTVGTLFGATCSPHYFFLCWKQIVFFLYCVKPQLEIGHHFFVRGRGPRTLYIFFFLGKGPKNPMFFFLCVYTLYM